MPPKERGLRMEGITCFRSRKTRSKEDREKQERRLHREEWVRESIPVATEVNMKDEASAFCHLRHLKMTLVKVISIELWGQNIIQY